MSLVNDLLDIYQIKKGKFTNRIVETNTFAFIEDIKNLIEILIKNRPIELILNISDDIPDILMFDSDRIAQVLINLISNALKFTKTGYLKLSGTYYKDL